MIIRNEIMFYNIIQRKRNEWLSREDCPIKSLLSYIEDKGAMRADIDAIIKEIEG